MTDQLANGIAVRRRAVRGLLLGVVGDALGAVKGTITSGSTPLRNTVGAQLACFTTEGLIRASVRQTAKGICHPPSVVWHALARWAFGQGIPADVLYSQWAGGGDHWPDGWLAQVPILRERRGNAPATVTALQAGTPGTKDEPTTDSRGSHALTRASTVAAVPAAISQLHELAADIAAQTHGAPGGYITASETAVLAACCLSADDTHLALRTGIKTVRRIDRRTRYADAFHTALEQGAESAGRADPTVLHTFAHERTASATVTGALFAAAAHPRPEQILDALRFAAPAPGVAAVTGALLGAVHGADALSVEVLSRCELLCVADTLARDLVAEFDEAPQGHESLTLTAPGQYAVGWVEGSEPAWWQRYPGW